MRKPSPKTANVRTRLLESTAQLFCSQGFHATGLEEILERSATPKGSLYHYFPGGKDHLAIEALRHMTCQLEQSASALLSSKSDPLKAVPALFDFAARRLAESNFRDGCPIAAVTLDVASDRDSIREACEEAFQKWLDLLVQQLRRAGLTAPRAKAIATLCLASLEGGLVLSRAQRSIAPLKAIAVELAHVIESTVAARAEQSFRSNFLRKKETRSFAPGLRPRCLGDARTGVRSIRRRRDAEHTGGLLQGHRPRTPQIR
jgi:TetR/AcrR family transcriptional regulator, lmrAB and yxaGH operons repressor